MKSLGKYVGDMKGVTGASILGDGRVVLILDVGGLIATAGASATMTRKQTGGGNPPLMQQAA